MTIEGETLRDVCIAIAAASAPVNTALLIVHAICARRRGAVQTATLESVQRQLSANPPTT